MNAYSQSDSCPLGNGSLEDGSYTAHVSDCYCSYYELVQNVNSIIFVLTSEGKIRFANQFACNFFGYTVDELLGTSVFEKIVPQYDEMGKELATQLSEAIKYPEQMESNINENQQRDGTRVWIAWRNQAIRDANGNLIEILTVGNDITDRKNVSEEIRHSEKTLRQTMDSAMQPVLIAEPSMGRILEANQQFGTIFGYAPEEYEKLSLGDLICETTECTYNKVLQALKRAGSSSKRSKQYSVFECLCRRKNGETYWAEMTLSYLERDSMPRNLCIIYDISDRKKSEERLLLQRNRLADLLQAQERERRLIAYEIHDGPAQHLVAATMYLEICQQMLDKDRNTVEQTLAEGRTMLDQALLEIRRLIAGLRPPQLDDAGVIAAIQTLVEEASETPKIRFECDVHFKRLEPLAENALFRIVQESLTNATRYSQSETITVNLMQTNGHIRLEIQDEGIGFQPDKVQNNRFGLNGIRERASVLGGHAVIRSAPGFGTRITVELPSSLIVE